MELAKVEQLVDAYFEGTTTLQEESSLRAYFSGEEIAPHLVPYQPIFIAAIVAQQETHTQEVVFPKQSTPKNRLWIGVAASAALAIGVAGFFFQEQALTAEEQEALAAFEKTKEAFQLLSSSFNDGAQELTYLSNFAETKDKILK